MDWEALGLLALLAAAGGWKALETRCPKCKTWFAALEREWREQFRTAVSYKEVKVTIAVRNECAKCGHSWMTERTHRAARTSPPGGGGFYG